MKKFKKPSFKSAKFRKPRIRFTKKLFTFMIIVGVVLWIVGGSLWYTRLYMTPERRFWAAIENGLVAGNVTKTTITPDANGQATTWTRINLGASPYIETKTETLQKTSTETSSTIITRTLNTIDNNYVQYEKIATDEKKESGEPFDFSEAEGKWAIQQPSAENPNINKNGFSEAFVQLVPLANLSPGEAREFVDEMRKNNVYGIDFGLAEDDALTGLTSYGVKLNTKAYVQMLEDLYQRLGLEKIAGVEADDYEASSSITVKMGIDGANQVRQINFTSEQYDSYGDYGIRGIPVIPKDTITVEELQQLITEAQQ